MSTKRKVYTFYIIAILVMVLVLMLFDLTHIAAVFDEKLKDS